MGGATDSIRCALKEDSLGHVTCQHNALVRASAQPDLSYLFTHVVKHLHQRTPIVVPASHSAITAAHSCWSLPLAMSSYSLFVKVTHW